MMPGRLPLSSVHAHQQQQWQQQQQQRCHKEASRVHKQNEAWQAAAVVFVVVVMQHARQPRQQGQQQQQQMLHCDQDASNIHRRN
jgi:orotidine-5'-phosphate decarboxylase